MEFTLTGRPGERAQFVEVLEAFCRANSVPDSVRHAADLALEEHLTNIFSYAFESGRQPFMVVKLSIRDGKFSAEVTDTGIPFDSRQVPPVDTSIPLELKPVGGLGLHLIRESMDELYYERTDGKNIFTMEKRLGESPA